MNEAQFIDKVKEVSDQINRKLESIKKDISEVKEWVATLDFFIKKRKELENVE